MALPFIPETITVHLGPPGSNAQNVTVPFPNYVKNVASSEIYPTWPESAIRANMLAQISFALNRVYTEWYRSQGYDFDITSSTAYDQSFVPDRDIFENISQIADEIFTDYLIRPGSVEPLFAQYCDGIQTTCSGLSQWGTVPLAEQGLGAYDILTSFYGTDLAIVRNTPVSPNLGTYPEHALRLGDISDDVRTIQLRLNRISNNYPLIPKIFPPDGIFDSETEEAVKVFQQTFGLTADGIVGKATWYRIAYLYTAIKRLAELNSEGETIENVTPIFPTSLEVGDTGIFVRVVQYYLKVLSLFFESIPYVADDGFFGARTEEAVIAAQQLFGMPVTGIVTMDFYNRLNDEYLEILRANPNLMLDGNIPAFPGRIMVEGMTGPDVLQAQTALNYLAASYPELTQTITSGYFGEQTVANVLAFQTLFDIGAAAPGTIGPIAWDTLQREYQTALERTTQAEAEAEAAQPPAEAPAAEPAPPAEPAPAEPAPPA